MRVLKGGNNMKTNITLAGIATLLLLLAMPATASDYTLGVFGNANEDDTINMQDVTYTELIILEYRDQTELSDAKYDGKINMQDVTQIELVILGKEKELTVLDSAERTVTIDKPVERIVLINSNLIDQIRAMGVIDRIVGIPIDTSKNVDYYPELADVPVVGSWDNTNYELIMTLDPDLVIPWASWSPQPPDKVQEILAPAGIKVLGFDFYRVDVFYKELTTLGYILDTEEEVCEYINFFQSWTDRIDEVVGEIEPDEKKSVYFEAEAKYRTYGGTGYGCGIPGMVRDAGGNYIYDDTSAPYTFEVDPEDLIERNPDVIFKGTGVGMNGYTLIDTSELEEVRDEILNRPELALVTAVENGDVYAISWGIAGGKGKIFGPVYIAKCLYPEKFEDLEPNDYMKEYLEEWQGIPYQGVYIYPYPIE